MGFRGARDGTNDMTGHRCTQHPEHRRRNGRCLDCRSAASSKYARSCVEARRKLKAIEAALLSA